MTVAFTHDDISNLKFTYYLSADNIAGNADDFPVTDRHDLMFVVGPWTIGTENLLPRLEIPADLPRGEYHIVARVELADGSADRDESNNTLITPGTIEAGSLPSTPPVTPIDHRDPIPLPPTTFLPPPDRSVIPSPPISPPVILPIAGGHSYSRIQIPRVFSPDLLSKCVRLAGRDFEPATI